MKYNNIYKNSSTKLKALVMATVASFMLANGSADAQNLQQAADTNFTPDELLFDSNNSAKSNNGDSLKLKEFKKDGLFTKNGAITGLAAELPSNPLGEDSIYTLTPVLSAAGSNVITVSTFDNTQNQVVYKFYKIEFKTPVIGSGADVKYFKWVKENGTVKLIASDSADGAALTYKYDSANPDTDKFIGRDIKNLISSASTSAVSYNFTGNTLNITGADGYAYSVVNAELGGNINSIKSSFVGNSITVTDNNVTGTLVKSAGTINTLQSEFLSNTLTSNTSVKGGLVAVNDNAVLNTINSEFVENTVTAQSITGGSVYNNAGGTIGNIAGSFVNNKITATNDAFGAALANSGSITGNIHPAFFSGNIAKSISGNARGGAIYNDGSITGVIKNTSFIGNSAVATSGNALGGAIYTTTWFLPKTQSHQVLKPKTKQFTLIPE